MVTSKFFENCRRAFLRVGHATTVGKGAKRVTGVDVGEKVAFSETIESRSRVNDDAPWGKDALGLGLIQLDGGTHQLEQLYSRYDERACRGIMSFLLAFDAFNVSTDVVRGLPGRR